MIKLQKRLVLSRVLLAVLVLSALILILKVRFSPQLELTILVSATILYLAWALAYHHFDKSLTLDVFMEYVLIAILALILLLGVLL